MTQSKKSGTGRTRNYDRPVNKPSTIRGPNYLAQESAQEFVPSQVLISAHPAKAALFGGLSASSFSVI